MRSAAHPANHLVTDWRGQLACAAQPRGAAAASARLWARAVRRNDRKLMLALATQKGSSALVGLDTLDHVLRQRPDWLGPLLDAGPLHCLRGLHPWGAGVSSALHVAVNTGRPDQVEALLLAGASPSLEATDAPWRWTWSQPASALMCAVRLWKYETEAGRVGGAQRASALLLVAAQEEMPDDLLRVAPFDPCFFEAALQAGAYADVDPPSDSDLEEHRRRSVFLGWIALVNFSPAVEECLTPRGAKETCWFRLGEARSVAEFEAGLAAAARHGFSPSTTDAAGHRLAWHLLRHGGGAALESDPAACWCALEKFGHVTSGCDQEWPLLAYGMKGPPRKWVGRLSEERPDLSLDAETVDPEGSHALERLEAWHRLGGDAERQQLPGWNTSGEPWWDWCLPLVALWKAQSLERRLASVGPSAPGPQWRF